MKKVEIAITTVTIYLVLFLEAPYIGVGEGVIFTMFFLSPFLIIYMVYVVLKYGKLSDHSFDERFYDDWDYKRNGKEELEERK